MHPKSAETRASRLARGFLLGWLVVMLGLGTLLVLKHKVPLPEALSSREIVAKAVALTRAGDDQKRWLTLHVLYQDCGCSARVLDALLLHRSNPQVVERIVFVTDTAAPVSLASRARDLGYRFETLSRDELVERYHLQAAPVLVLLSPANALSYMGGYSLRPRGPELEDRHIIERSLRGERVPPLPTFGCAVGRRLAARTNPLSL